MLKDFAIFGKSFTKNEHPQRHAQKGHTKTGCQCVICQNYFKIIVFFTKRRSLEILSCQRKERVPNIEIEMLQSGIIPANVI